MTTELICLDFETRWGADYTLHGMSTEEYIADKRFSVHGVSVWQSSQPEFQWWSHEKFKGWAKGQDWSRIAAIGHNMKFDGAILAWRYGIVPAFYVDTLAIANVFIRPFTGSASLDACSRYLGLPLKSGALMETKGLTTMDVLRTPGLWERLGAYAVQDGRNCLAIFKTYWGRVNQAERRIIDWAIRTWVRGRLALDVPLLVGHLGEVEAERQRLLEATGLDDPKILRSRARFAAELEKLGVVVVYKRGKTDEDIPAVAKTDDFMRDLLNSDDPKIKFLAQAKLAWSSSLEITRTQRLIDHARVTGGRLCVPLMYGAAHTLRFGGTERMNLQNLGRRSRLRHAIRARPGRKLVIADYSQIECRLVGWFARCESLLQAFRDGIDVYCDFGSSFYGYPLSREATPIEREVSKVAVLQLGYQSGSQKLYDTLRLQAVEIDFQEADAIVKHFRNKKYPEIRNAWYSAEDTLRDAISNRQTYGWRGCLFTPEGIKLPSGRDLLYPQLSLSDDAVPRYWSAKYSSWQQLYGGAIIENLCQSTARDIITETHLKWIDDVVLQIHDELILEVPENLAKETLEYLLQDMHETPSWLPGLPVAAEGRIADCYGKQLQPSGKVGS